MVIQLFLDHVKKKTNKKHAFSYTHTSKTIYVVHYVKSMNFFLIQVIVFLFAEYQAYWLWFSCQTKRWNDWSFRHMLWISCICCSWWVIVHKYRHSLPLRVRVTGGSRLPLTGFSWKPFLKQLEALLHVVFLYHKTSYDLHVFL